ncbi:unnamed protein product [Meloidogyne enterolobii]|uniref:Uncharacterized protein n=1 Tax=Meloidogyne enterolobii TaxID=390850 RepID=A0ACB1A3Z5_MELEN
MPEVLNIPIVESTTSRYKPSNLTRVASIVVCFLFAALISTLTVRYFSSSAQVQEVVDQRQTRIPSISERMDALHSKVAELERTVDVISRKNHLSWNDQQSKNLPFPRSGFRNMEASSEPNRLQQQKQIFQQLQSQMLPRPRAHLLAPQGQLEPQNSFEKRMVSWQPVKREDSLPWTEEINEQKIYDAIARERGKFFNF